MEGSVGKLLIDDPSLAVPLAKGNQKKKARCAAKNAGKREVRSHPIPQNVAFLKNHRYKLLILVH